MILTYTTGMSCPSRKGRSGESGHWSGTVDHSVEVRFNAADDGLEHLALANIIGASIYDCNLC